MNTAAGSPFSTITVEDADRVRTITLNRPEVFNAVSARLGEELLGALGSAAEDANVRVVVLTGAGKAFCAGQDLAELKETYAAGNAPEMGRLLRDRYNRLARALCTMEKPTIAAVNGIAAGAGCSLALACDMRIASEHAAFMEAFINVGLAPDTAGTITLPRLVGYARAMELCCTGRKVDADEADRIGLVNHVVPHDELMAETMKLAMHLARMPARGIALTKRLLNESHVSDLETQLEAEAEYQDIAGRTADHLEGVTAFLEKRAPQFRGE